MYELLGNKCICCGEKDNIYFHIDHVNNDGKDGHSVMLKEYLEINVKNDDQLVKIAAIVQRLISTESKGGSDDEFGLSDAEKEQLMNAVEEVAADVQKHSDDISSEVNKFEN